MKKKPIIQGLRQKKVGSLIQQEIAQFLSTSPIPSLTGLVTIQTVEVSPDLKEGKVWFTVLGQDSEAVLKFLNGHLYEIQGELYRGSTMKIVPKVKFYIDHSVEYAERINELFYKIKDDQQ